MTHWGTSFAADAHLLRLLAPDGTERIITLLGRQDLKIGSSPEADLRLEGPGIAPRHCRIFEQGGRLHLIDHGSPAGTLIDDRRCVEPTVLHEGQRIGIGLYLIGVLPGRAHLGTEAIARQLAYDPGDWDAPQDYFVQLLEQAATAWSDRKRPRRLLLRGPRLERAATLSPLPAPLEPWLTASAALRRRRQGTAWFLAGLFPGLAVASLVTLAPQAAPPAPPEPPLRGEIPPPNPPPTPCKAIEHRVVPGETLDEVARYYDLDPPQIALDNRLDPGAPLDRTRPLKLCAFKDAQIRVETAVRVRSGDTWESLAREHNVTPEHLWASNPDRLQGNPAPEELRRHALPEGIAINLWLDKPPRQHHATATPISPPTIALPIGSPNDGMLSGTQISRSPLWDLRCSSTAHGTSFTIEQLNRAVHAFRDTEHYEGQLIVADLSKKSGGSYGPHVSHQSGRDVDVWLPVRGGLYDELPECERCGTRWCRPDPEKVDWARALGLVRALDATGHVENIFLDQRHFDPLRQAARDAQLSPGEIDRLIQPRPRIPAVITHEPRHTQHFHVRFRCGPHEDGCTRR